jgi:hypothetical protein
VGGGGGDKDGTLKDSRDAPDMTSPNSMKVLEIQNYFIDGKVSPFPSSFISTSSSCVMNAFPF